MPDPIELEMPLPFGVSAATGAPLEPLDERDLQRLAADERMPARETRIVERRAAPADAVFAVVGDIDPNDLSQAGWGVIFAPGTSAEVRAALDPLLRHRQAQAGDALFKVFDGADAYRAGESGIDWLARHGVTLNVVEPDLGVPFYLTIVGSPEQIPFDFQYTLDIYWAVGRLHFPAAEGYRRYAESVVAYETAAKVPTVREVALFATAHDFDRATQLFTSKVARPLVEGSGPTQPLGTRQRFTLRPHLGDGATRQALSDIYRGRNGGGAPALVFSGTHGMEFPLGDPRLPDKQGALVCQDWGGYGAITEDDWFAASDIPGDARLNGLVHVMFACYGAGCPRVDNFNRRGQTPRVIASEAFISRLPQALLTHPNGGALAVLGHVERAWGYSFLSERGGSQIQGFRDVMGRLLRGERVGQALDQFNVRWAALSADLSEVLDAIGHGGTVPGVELANKWVARDDARNYIIFGDPAVRLRVEDMPPV